MLNPTLAKNILDGIAGSVNQVTFTSVPYLGLFTSMPSAGGGGTEVAFTSGGSPTGYARVNLTATGPYGKRLMASASDNTSGTTDGIYKIENQDLITFPMCVDANGWGSVVGYGVYKTSTGTTANDLMYWAPFTSSKSVAYEEIPVIKIGELKITLDGTQSVSSV